MLCLSEYHERVVGINISERDCFEISTCREREEESERKGSKPSQIKNNILFF